MCLGHIISIETGFGLYDIVRCATTVAPFIYFTFDALRNLVSTRYTQTHKRKQNVHPFDVYRVRERVFENHK